jgi:hypothetical protein
MQATENVEEAKREPRRTRVDRQDRQAYLKTVNLSTTDVGFGVLWREDATSLKESFSKHLEKMILAMTQIRKEGSLLAEVHLRRLMDENKPLPKLNATFFSRCIRLVNKTIDEAKEILDGLPEVEQKNQRFEREIVASYLQVYREEVRPDEQVLPLAVLPTSANYAVRRYNFR